MARRTKRAKGSSPSDKAARVQLDTLAVAGKKRGRKRVPRADWNPETFRMLRQASGWTMSDMADKLGICQSALYNMQGSSTYNPPTKAVAVKIAKLLGVEVETLGGEVGDFTFHVTHNKRKA